MYDCMYTGYNFNLVTRIRKDPKGTLRSSVGLAELSQSLHHLLHDIRWRRNDHSDVSRGVEAHSRKDKHRLISVQGGGEADIVAQVRECRVIDFDEHVQGSLRGGAR